MALLPILVAPDPRLKKISKPVEAVASEAGAVEEGPGGRGFCGMVSTAVKGRLRIPEPAVLSNGRASPDEPSSS